MLATLIVWFCLAYAGCGLSAPTSVQQWGTLEGRVQLPAYRAGQPALVPAPAAAVPYIVIAKPTGDGIAAVELDASGHYSIRLPPGNYLVELPSEFGASYSSRGVLPQRARAGLKDLPASVAVVEGRTTQLDIVLALY